MGVEFLDRGVHPARHQHPSLVRRQAIVRMPKVRVVAGVQPRGELSPDLPFDVVPISSVDGLDLCQTRQ